MMTEALQIRFILTEIMKKQLKIDLFREIEERFDSTEAQQRQKVCQTLAKVEIFCEVIDNRENNY